MERGGDEACVCCGVSVVNVQPKVVLALVITLLVLVFCIVYMSVYPNTQNVFLPIVMSLVGLWVPSPANVLSTTQLSRAIEKERRMSAVI